MGSADISPFNATPTPTLLSSSSPSHSSSSPTLLPSISATSLPSISPSFHPSLSPSSLPSISLTSLPTLSLSFHPSSLPTLIPSVLPSFVPSLIPTLSLQPSFSPTLSMIPSSTPSLSSFPSSQPSQKPSHVPTASPSALPTHAESSEITSKYELIFIGDGLQPMQPPLIESIMDDIQTVFKLTGYHDDGRPKGYIDDVPPKFVYVNATFLEKTHKERDDNEFLAGLTFEIKFSSRKVDVEGYPDKFKNFMKSEDGHEELHLLLRRDGYIDSNQEVKIELNKIIDALPIASPTLAPIATPMPSQPSPPSKDFMIIIIPAGIAGCVIFLLLVLYFVKPFYELRKAEKATRVASNKESEQDDIEMVSSVGDLRSYLVMAHHQGVSTVGATALLILAVTFICNQKGSRNQKSF